MTLPLISFSLYGDRPMYLQGMVENAKLAPEVYPGWAVRVYCGKGLPEPLLKELKGLGCEICRVGISLGHSGMLWRMLPLWEEPHRRIIFRDADSRLNVREAAAVEEWIESGFAAHTMHDHPYHAGHKMMGGVWGCLSGLFQDSMLAVFKRRYAKHDQKGMDSRMMDREIYPIIAESLLTHSSVEVAVELKWPAKPFPKHSPWEGFVGQQIGDDGEPLWAKMTPQLRTGGELP